MARKSASRENGRRRECSTLYPLSLEDVSCGVIATGRMDEDAKKPERTPDEAKARHHAKRDDPVERAKTATRESAGAMQRIKRKGAS